MNGIPLINGRTYDWGDINLLIAGVPVTGVVGIEYKDDQEKTDNYGAGRYPVSRSRGKITTTAKITLDMKEVEALQSRSRTGRLQDIDPFKITVSYIPDTGTGVVNDILNNVEFKSNGRSWKQGDTKQDVELDLICSHITWGEI